MKKLRRVVASSSKQTFRVWYNPYNYPDEEDYIDVTAVDEDEARRKARSMGYVTEVEIKEDAGAKATKSPTSTGGEIVKKSNIKYYGENDNGVRVTIIKGKRGYEVYKEHSPELSAEYSIPPIGKTSTLSGALNEANRWLQSRKEKDFDGGGFEIKEDVKASKVVAGKYSDPFNEKLDGSAVVKHGPTMRYMCHYGNIESPEFVASLSKIAPYDDAEYVWARIYENKKVDFIKDGHAIDSMQLPRYDEDNYESAGEYVDDCIDIVVLELNEFNQKIKPVMVHN